MDIAQAITVADVLIVELHIKTLKVKDIGRKFKEKCLELDDEITRTLNQSTKEIEMSEKAQRFCTLSRDEQKEFLKQYNGDDDAHQKK